MSGYIKCGNCLDLMKQIKTQSIDLTVTSPPYDNLRDYKSYSFDFEYKRDIREADAKILYLCDGEKCGPDHDCLECKHTKDINHARNFKRDDTGAFWEKYEEVCVNEIKPKIIKRNQAPTQPLNWIRKNNRLVCPVCEAETEKYTNFCSVCETFLT